MVAGRRWVILIRIGCGLLLAGTAAGLGHAVAQDGGTPIAERAAPTEVLTPTPTATPTETTTETPMAAPVEPTPTETPTILPEPTVEPTVEATSEPPATEIAGAPTPTPEPTITPTAAPTASPSPSPTVTLRIDQADLTFGTVSGLGDIDPAVAGVTSSVDESGADYTKEGAIHLTVVSDGPWEGTCRAGENTGSASTVRIDDGRLAWRLSGATEWTPYGAGPSDCFPDPVVGEVTYSFDLRLRVERTDPPGSFAAAITFTVSPTSPHESP